MAEEIKYIQLRDEGGVKILPKTLGKLVINNAGDNLGTVEAGAQVNKLEKIKVNGIELTIVNKTANVEIPAAAEYGLASGTPAEGFQSTYFLTKDGVELEGSARINVAKDQFLKAGSVKLCEATDEPIEGLKIGDAYIDLELQENDEHIYIPAKDLVNNYLAGTGIIVDANKIAIDETVVTTKAFVEDLESVKSGITAEKVATYEAHIATEPDPNTLLLWSFDGTNVDKVKNCAVYQGVGYTDGKFGQAVGVNTGTFAYAPITITSEQDFTVDFWGYCGNAFLGLSLSDDGNFGGFNFSKNGVIVRETNTIVPVSEGWHHLAYQRKNGIFEYFCDGIKVATGTEVNGYAHGNRLGFLRVIDGGALIDELRISGIARYSGNFSVPTEAYELTSGNDIHVTKSDKAIWSAKQDALNAEQLKAVNSGITSEKLAELEAFADGKQDKLTDEQLAAVNSGFTADDKSSMDAHIANTEIHVTTENKTSWNGKVNTVDYGSDQIVVDETLESHEDADRELNQLVLFYELVENGTEEPSDEVTTTVDIPEGATIEFKEIA